jgi:predicted O-linked N-acetylglucosamine transferase (SPINDLY family)
MQQALAFHQAGLWAQAQKMYEDVLQAQPDHADAWHLLGVLAHQTGQPQRAVELIGQALRWQPGNAAFYFNRGIALQDQKHWAQALVSYEQALALQPDYVDAYANRGIVLKELRHPEAAVASYDQAIARRPADAELYYNRGNAYKELKNMQAAIANYDQALALQPRAADAHYNRGNALHELKQLGAALISYQQAMQIQPDYDFLAGKILHTQMGLCDWSGFAQAVTQIADGLQQGRKVAAPFAIMAAIDDAGLQKKAAQMFATTLAGPAGDLPDFVQNSHPPVDAAVPRKIRVAYYSADYYNHATAYLMAQLFESHDRSKFEWYAFSFGPDVQDEMRTRVAAAFDHFIDVRGKTDHEITQLSRELGIDIAVDLKGYTRDARAGIFAGRCAPVQVSYLGYPGTMGVDYIDYLIADFNVIPAGQEADYTEKIVRLPDCYQVNDAQRPIAATHDTREELGLPAQGFVFCCFNNNYKITPPVFDSWMRILQQVPGSVLWLLADQPAVVQQLRQQAEQRGVAGSRLVFAARLGLAEHLARHRQAHLFIDTFPCNAHTTASDALWADLPVLTRMGQTFASRVAGSLLHTLGLPELITHSATAYEARAIELAHDPKQLDAIQQKLHAQRLRSPLFQAQGFARQIEAAYVAMHARRCAGLLPEHIQV